MTRTQNATRNIFYGLLYRLEHTIVPFVTRTILLYFMGAEYVGLNSLFVSILSFLSLAELGIGNALVYSMYDPVAKDDKKKLSALLNFYRKTYRIIGLIVLIIGLLIIPFLPLIIKDIQQIELSTNIKIISLYLVYLFNSVSSYLFFGYRQSLLIANQRNDIVSKRTAIVQLAMNVCQIIVIIVFRNYYFYVIFIPLTTIIANLANYITTCKMYPDIKCSGYIDKEFRSKIIKETSALFGDKLNIIIVGASDSILISSFISVVMVGIYGNYCYITTSIIGILTIVYTSLTAGLGNSLVEDNKEKIYNDFSVLTFMNNWLITMCSSCLICLFQPFLYIWVGREYMLGTDLIILMCIQFYLSQFRRILLTYKDAGGLWWEDRFRPYIECAVNLILKVILMKFIGLYGVVIANIISVIVSILIENNTVFTKLFRKKSIEYCKIQVLYIFVATFSCLLAYFACCWLPDGILFLIIRLLISLIVPNVVLLICFMKNKYFKTSINLIKNRFFKKNKTID